MPHFDGHLGQESITEVKTHHRLRPLQLAEEERYSFLLHPELCLQDLTERRGTEAGSGLQLLFAPHRPALRGLQSLSPLPGPLCPESERLLLPSFHLFLL